MKLLLLVVAILIAITNVLGAEETSRVVFPSLDGTHNTAYNTKEVVDPYSEITFHLFTRSNPDNATQIFVGDLSGSHYDPSKPTRFIVHGYNANGFQGGNLRMKDAFLRAEDCNFICVDWSGPGGGLLYNVCRANAKPTGDYIAEFYGYLASVGASMSDMHCLGHSLGAHVCGYSGKAGNGVMGRITGLDPALALFDFEIPEERLTDTDAQFVDIIHTCGGYLAFHNPIGHVDFYPNDGTMVQPGCEPDISGSCSHGIGFSFFIESVESNAFVSYKCDSWDNFLSGVCDMNEVVSMGYPTPASTRGTFYLATASEPPYALG